MKAFDIEFDKFIWMLECGTFQKINSSIQMVANQAEDSLSLAFSASGRFFSHLSCDIQNVELSGEDFTLKFLNGQNRQGIPDLISDLKALKSKTLTIQDCGKSLLFQTDKGKFAKQKVDESMIMVEWDAYFNTAHPTTEIHYDLDCIDPTVFKNIEDAAKKMTRPGSTPIVVLEKNPDGLLSFGVTDSQYTKKFSFPLDNIDEDFEEMIMIVPIYWTRVFMKYAEIIEMKLIGEKMSHMSLSYENNGIKLNLFLVVK